MRYLSERFLQTCKLGGLFLLIGFTGTTVCAQSSSDTTYVVKDGDSLTEIGIKYGDVDYWKPIFDANREKINNPDEIYAGQTLIIPSSVTSAEKSSHTPDPEIANKPSEHDDQNAHGKDLTQSANAEKGDSSKTIEKFRKAFEKVVRQNEKEDKEEGNKKAKTQEKGDPTNLEFGGLVLNRTTSRMGRDFFKAFNDKWQAPEEIGNFMLQISEQPIPSMGTMVEIKIDNQVVFKARLQPRQDAIQQKVRQSIVMCYRYLQQQISSSSQPKIY